MRNGRAMVAVGLLVLLVGCQKENPRFTVLAETSLRGLMIDVQLDPELPADLAFDLVTATAGALSEQVRKGAYGDLLLGADDSWSQAMGAADKLGSQDPCLLARNRLAVVVRKPDSGATTSLESVEDLLRLERISMADTAEAPLGRYTQQWLEAANVWSHVKPNAVESYDARAALALVQGGSAQAGIVFVSDARASPKVEVKFVVDGADAPDIRFSGTVLARGKNARQARALIEYLCSPRGREHFARHGFLVPDQT